MSIERYAESSQMVEEEDESDYDDDQDEDMNNSYLVHDLVEQGSIERLRELLPSTANQDDDGGKPLSVRLAENSLLEKDDMGCLPIHIAIIYQRMDCVLHLLNQSEAMTMAMCRMKCADFNTPLIHLILRVGGINPTFTTTLITTLFTLSEQETKIWHQHDVRAVLMETLEAKDDEGNTIFHLCAMYNLHQCFQTLGLFYTTQSSNKLDVLLEKGNRIGFRILHLGIKFQSLEMVLILLKEYHVNINSRTILQQTPAHIASLYGSVECAKALMETKNINLLEQDVYGTTPIDIVKRSTTKASKELLKIFTGEESTDSQSMTPQTRFFYHPESLRHLPMAYHRRGGTEPPPENPERIDTLVDPLIGILRSQEFHHVTWEHEIEAADMGDILRVHEFYYVQKLRERCHGLAIDTNRDQDQDDDPQEGFKTVSLDPDTALSLRSYDAAARAAGAVCCAVDQVLRGDCTNAFCIVRPPGHHAGPTGKVTCTNDPEGSHGFCLFNNVAIGAAYARSHYKHQGIDRIAIIDFDVHHGNGTEAMIQQLQPSSIDLPYETPYGRGKQTIYQYKPWRNEQDSDHVLFASVHGYGHKDPAGEFAKEMQGAWFYPGSGATIVHEKPLIYNIGMPYYSQGVTVARLQWRKAFREQILPHIASFKPDLIFLSSGFDAHKKEQVNWGYIGLVEQDYEWLLHHIQSLATSYCQGRVISVLEGGYNFHGRMISPFARSVAAHARALANRVNQPWNPQQLEKESAYEATLLAHYMTKHEQDQKDCKKREMIPEEPIIRSKRVRKPVDYVALAAKIDQE